MNSAHFGLIAMTCAKVVVRATLKLPGGSVFHGENWCHNPQSSCPRLPGEGYEKCKSICNQPNHAEMDAILKAAMVCGVDAVRGSKMHVSYRRICDRCGSDLRHFGITGTFDAI